MFMSRLCFFMGLWIVAGIPVDAWLTPSRVHWDIVTATSDFTVATVVAIFVLTSRAFSKRQGLT